MTDIVLFHHALGRTEGTERHASWLRDAGHVVHTPDLFEGRTFSSIDDGVAYAMATGFNTILERAHRAVEVLPTHVVYIGQSLGVVPAQALAQTRSGARGAVFLYSCVPVGEFGSWPQDVPVQIHGMGDDPYFRDEGDLAAAQELVSLARAGELFIYDGDQHYFADDTLPSFRPDADALVRERVLRFLASLHDVDTAASQTANQRVLKDH